MNGMIGVTDFAASIAALILAIAAHEGGHVLGGALGGLRFALFVVGPLELRREQRPSSDVVRPGLNRNKMLYGGAAAMLPGPRVKSLRRSLASFVAGGPLVSLVLGVIGLTIFVASGLPIGNPSASSPPQALVIAGHALFAFAVGSLGVGIITLAPWRAQGLLSDGLRSVQLLRSHQHGDREAALLALGGCSLAGWRARDWDDRLLEKALSIPDGSYSDVMAHYLAYLAALDREQVTDAAHHIGYAVAHVATMPAAFRPVVLCEGAYFDAAYRREPDTARRQLETAGTSALLDEATRSRAEAAILFAGGHGAQARAAARRARAAARHTGDAFTLAELDRLGRSMADTTRLVTIPEER